MIIDELELENMIDTTIKRLLVKNDSIKKQLVTILPNFFNESTEYYYDKKRKEITSIMLEEEQLHLLYKELATALVNDKYLKEEEKIIEEKKIRKEKTIRMQIKIEDLEYIICHYQKTLFQINHHTHAMEEKIKKIIDEGYSSYLQANVEAYKKEQEEIEKEKIKLIEEIQMYNCTLKLISHIKKEEIKKEM